jgi:3-oxoacyl-[acyl-carrier protein] reductase
MTPDDLSGRIALVTGGSGALGSAVASALDARGMSVAVHWHSAKAEAEAMMSRLHHRALAPGADLTSWQETVDMVKAVEAELGPIGVLVNCVGISRDGLLVTQSPAAWAEVVTVNLIGTFHACRAVMRQMLKSRFGRIVSVTSPASLVGSPGQTAYSASKAGINGLTRSLARECAHRGVTVNAVSPGLMESTLTNRIPARTRQRILQAIPMGRICSPAEMARVVTMIIDTPYMTGQVISVDGGITS